jgi:hypothetical protein
MKKFEDLFDNLTDKLFKLDPNEVIVFTIHNKKEYLYCRYAITVFNIFGSQLLAVSQILGNIPGYVETFNFDYESEAYRNLPKIKNYLNSRIDHFIMEVGEFKKITKDIEDGTNITIKTYKTKVFSTSWTFSEKDIIKLLGNSR